MKSAPRRKARHRSAPHLRPSRFLLVGAALSLLCQGIISAAIPPFNEDSAAQAKYTCPAAATSADQLAVAQRLGSHTYSKNDLACASDMLLVIADDRSKDADAQIAALQALIRYLEAIRAIHAFDHGHINTGEYNARLERVRVQAKPLLSRAQSSWPNDPRILTLTSIVNIYTADGEHHLTVVRRSVAVLEHVIAIEPRTLNGLPQLTLAKLNLELPPLLGGDTATALRYLQSALAIDPDNVETLNYIADTQLQLGDTAEAKTVLRRVAELKPRTEADLQLFVDEWRTGEGLATRLGDEMLASRMGKQRSELLKAHPELLPRNAEVVLGHGGSNPITGATQYEGDLTRPSDSRVPSNK